MEFVRKLFDTADFPARWRCGNWSPFLGWLHIVSDLLIFLAYAAIPVSLAIILLRKRDVPFPWVVRLFVAFILSCGITHLIEAIIFYEPIYRIQGIAKAITGVVSLTAAIVLIRALPGLLSIRAVREENESLTAKLGEMESVASVLERERSDLETHSAQLTQKWRRVSTALEATGGVACHWPMGTDAFDWEVGLMECAQRAGLGSQRSPDWGALLGPAAAAEFHALCRQHAGSSTPFDYEAPVAGAPHVRLLVRAVPEPEVKGMPRSMIGFFRLWLAPHRRGR